MDAMEMLRHLKLTEMRLKSMALAYANGQADLSDLATEAIHYGAATQHYRAMAETLTEVGLRVVPNMPSVEVSQ